MGITSAWCSKRSSRARGQHIIAQQRAPLGEAAVAGEDHRRLFVAGGHEIKQLLGLTGGQAQVADLVNHQQARGQIAPALLAPAGGLQFVGELPQGREARRIARFQRPGGEGQGQMGFPHARWAEQDDIGRRLQEAQGAQFLDETFGEGRLEGEVEALQGLGAGQMGGADAAGKARSARPWTSAPTACARKIS